MAIDSPITIEATARVLRIFLRAVKEVSDD